MPKRKPSKPLTLREIDEAFPEGWEVSIAYDSAYFACGGPEIWQRCDAKTLPSLEAKIRREIKRRITGIPGKNKKPGIPGKKGGK